MAAAWAAACLAACVSATDARAGDLASPPAHRGAFREVERQGEGCEGGGRGAFREVERQGVVNL
jgi:hypothetical protein